MSSNLAWKEPISPPPLPHAHAHALAHTKKRRKEDDMDKAYELPLLSSCIMSGVDPIDCCAGQYTLSPFSYLWLLFIDCPPQSIGCSLLFPLQILPLLRRIRLLDLHQVLLE